MLFLPKEAMTNITNYASQIVHMFFVEEAKGNVGLSALIIPFLGVNSLESFDLDLIIC